MMCIHSAKHVAYIISHILSANSMVTVVVVGALIAWCVLLPKLVNSKLSMCNEVFRFVIYVLYVTFVT